MTKIVLNPDDQKRLLKAVIKGEIETMDFPEVWREDLHITVRWPTDPKDDNLKSDEHGNEI